jgi:hypothetical protein
MVVDGRDDVITFLVRKLVVRHAPSTKHTQRGCRCLCPSLPAHACRGAVRQYHAAADPWAAPLSLPLSLCLCLSRTPALATLRSSVCSIVHGSA